MVNENGIEKEDLDTAETHMKEPFDPTLINIETKTPSLDTLIERIANKEIELDTSNYFQREPNLWDNLKKSRLIESILIRFPLPAFYFDGSNKSRWLVIDGLQRLTAIKQFVVDGSLKLTNLEFLTSLNEKNYENIGRDLQRIIRETQVVIYIINPGTPVDVKFNIFKRINTGGLALEPQEIRHALFQGKPANFIAELSSISEFEEATDGALKKNHRMLDREFVNRFLSFYLLGIENYESDLDSYMSKAMATINSLDEVEKQNIKANFTASMKLNREVFGNNAFRKIDPSIKGRNPINKALFDVFSVQFALIDNNQRKIISKYKDKFLEDFIKLLKSQDRTFYLAISSSTDDRKRVIFRHSTIKNLINQTIHLEDDSIYKSKEL